MKHLVNWIEIPVTDMERAKHFYSVILDMSMEEMTMGDLTYAFLVCEDQYNCGALVQGDAYVPSSVGIVVYLNGGEDLDLILSKVNSAGGNVTLPKTFLSDMAGYVGMFIDTEGNRIGVQSMK